jgi:hypothetical protein
VRFIFFFSNYQMTSSNKSLVIPVNHELQQQQQQQQQHQIHPKELNEGQNEQEGFARQ